MGHGLGPSTNALGYGRSASARVCTYIFLIVLRPRPKKQTHFFPSMHNDFHIRLGLVSFSFFYFYFFVFLIIIIIFGHGWHWHGLMAVYETFKLRSPDPWPYTGNRAPSAGRRPVSHCDPNGRVNGAHVTPHPPTGSPTGPPGWLSNWWGKWGILRQTKFKTKT